ncbi:uncharacterized protein PHACADRAFT_200095 [Phanerochaete carnosa HHB-10118-sp]|uniref:Uncharacterized protein n=1 Tax=Phanerochaete carnosa (strain HHB-10118-sp) TaxID=650164 RepID=K5UNF2_PHACS|nr:uncharacterized protein PHACADRAFT_200095 [Phanerochaete carnosa HHB-10118-sp]EKM51276.1 hypothetical protein PHACADRAFT_200095 [Phanerochaete carnosa HHB-10118-sp]
MLSTCPELCKAIRHLVYKTFSRHLDPSFEHLHWLAQLLEYSLKMFNHLADYQIPFTSRDFLRCSATPRETSVPFTQFKQSLSTQFTMPKDLPACPPHSVFQQYKHSAGYAPASGNANDPVETVPYGKRRGKELRPPTPALTLSFPPNSHEGRHLRREQFRECYATDKANFEQHLAAREIQQARERILAGLSKPTLKQRLAAIPSVTHTPIAPKLILIDFDKHTPANLVRIFTPKFDGTLKRIDVFETLKLDDLNSDQVRNLRRLIEQLTRIKRCLADVCNVVKYEKWRKWELGCRGIGDISFKGLRKNKARIVQALSAVYVNRYFDAVRFYENK